MKNRIPQMTAAHQQMLQISAQHPSIMTNLPPNSHEHYESRLMEFEQQLYMLRNRIDALESENELMKEIIEELENV